MKLIRDKWNRLKESKLLAKLRSVKNIEIILAAVLALIAIVLYFSVTAVSRAEKSAGDTSVFAEMTDSEKRLSDTISQIDGIGEASVLITLGGDGAPVGVVVVASGANSIEKRVQIIRCVEIATGVTVDKIQVYKKANGG